MSWRPLHRSLSVEAIELMDAQRANGLTPAPVHMMLVNDDAGRGQTGCGGGLGEWVTGDATQVTCDPCGQVVHA